jgi:hypothetical protein
MLISCCLLHFSSSALRGTFRREASIVVRNCCRWPGYSVDTACMNAKERHGATGVCTAFQSYQVGCPQLKEDCRRASAEGCSHGLACIRVFAESARDLR